MRFVISILVGLGAGGISAVLADSPTAAPATSAAPAATTSAPVSEPAPSVKSADPENGKTVVVQGTAKQDSLEKHFLAEGYKLEMRNGEKVFCRREERLGTRLGGQKVCDTAQRLQFTEQEAKATIERGQRQQTNPTGK